MGTRNEPCKSAADVAKAGNPINIHWCGCVKSRINFEWKTEVVEDLKEGRVTLWCLFGQHEAALCVWEPRLCCQSFSTAFVPALSSSAGIPVGIHACTGGAGE